VTSCSCVTSVTDQCDLVFCFLAMGGLLSPKPISYMQHTNGQFSDTHSNLAIHEDEKIYSLVIDLMDPNTREGALLELSKKREQYDDLALVLWHSFGEFALLYSSSDF